MEPLYHYHHHTDDDIVKNQLILEAQFWIDHLEADINEADYLAKIASNKIKDKVLRDTLFDTINDMIKLLNAFHSHRNILNTISECDELHCDHYFIARHQQHYKTYTTFNKSYSDLKIQVYVALLE
uniref:hypothetical protein n=1 Tax=Gelidibacter sp. TaxID=2018083 RepID=UPI0040499467